MYSKELILFTNRFPYYGGETFLETEIQYLSRAFGKVTICPQEKGDKYYGVLPENVTVNDLSDTGGLRLRSLIMSYWHLILRYYFTVLFRSRHRGKYLRQFLFTWNTLMGFIRRSEWVLNEYGDRVNRDSQHVTFYPYWFNEWASALSLARMKGMKGRFVVRAHGYDYDERQNGRGYFPFRELEMNCFDKIVQISEYGAGIMASDYPDSENVVVSRLGVHDGGFNAGKEDGPFRIVSCSGFVPLKRIPLMVEILAALKTPFEWVHFGGGEGLDHAVEYASRRLNQGSYHFKGYVGNAEIREYYRTVPVDLFFNTSNLEGIPVSMMEAISAGIPLAGFDICGIPEIVNAETGLLLSDDDTVTEIAGKLDKFLTGDCRSVEFRKGVKDFWHRYYNCNINYPGFVESDLFLK